MKEETKKYKKKKKRVGVAVKERGGGSLCL